MEQVKITGVFDNVNVKQNGEVAMRFKFPWAEIGSYTRLLLNIGKEMKVLIVNETEEKVPLGFVSFKQLSIDRDGEAKLTIVGEVPQVDISKVSILLEQPIYFYTKVESPETQEVQEVEEDD